MRQGLKTFVVFNTQKRPLIRVSGRLRLQLWLAVNANSYG